MVRFRLRYEMYSVASMALRVCLPLRIANWLAAEGGRESAANVISERHASRAAMAAAVRVCLWSLKFDPQLTNYDHPALTSFIIGLRKPGLSLAWRKRTNPGARAHVIVSHSWRVRQGANDSANCVGAMVKNR